MKVLGVLLPFAPLAYTAYGFTADHVRLPDLSHRRASTVARWNARPNSREVGVPSSSSSSDDDSAATMATDRRAVLRDGAFALGSVFAAAATAASPAHAAAVRAVGSAELSCREEGNCLEKFELDGAVGWTWGGKDRCDASDPLCGPNGKLLEEAPRGDAVPSPGENAMTDVVEIDLRIGREETLTMRMGLYGDACPSNVRRMLEFCSPELKGIDMISKRLLQEDQYYAFSVPVSMTRGGALNVIYPGQRIDFGVASQLNAYARSKGLSKAEGFTPQPRPDSTEGESSSRSHDCAGLISVPKNGIGYGGFGLESDDEAYSSAFQITAGPVPSMDREGRKVIGQLMDSESMAALARLSSLATKKGFKGVIPGQNAGPPLIKVTVTDITAKALPRSAAAAKEETS